MHNLLINNIQLLWINTPTPNYVAIFGTTLKIHPHPQLRYWAIFPTFAAERLRKVSTKMWHQDEKQIGNTDPKTNRENLRVDSQWIVAYWPLSALTKLFYPIMKRNKSRKLAGRFSVDRSTVATLSTYKTQMLIDRLSRISPLHVWKYISSWSHQRAPEIVDAACT